MSEVYDFFIAGRTRNKDNILEICKILDRLKISYYCFLKKRRISCRSGVRSKWWKISR